MSRATTFLFYGEFGSGKTLQLGQLAKWHYARTGEISRLISADSSWTSLDEDLLISGENPKGIVEPWNVESLPDPWNPLDATTRGYWPGVITRPDGSLGIKMSAPKFQDGKLLAQDGRVVGQVFYEGLSTLGNTGLFDHIRTQRQIGQDVVGKFTSSALYDVGGKEQSQSITLAKAGQSHFGQVQDWLLLDMVPKSGRLPVARVVWTAHEAKGTDEVTGIKDSVLGPLTVGKATVGKTVGKFGHSLHLTQHTSWVKDPKGQQVVQREWRAWFVNHPDEVLNRMMWPTKTSLPLVKSQELLRAFPGGYIPLTPERGIEWYAGFLQDGGTGK